VGFDGKVKWVLHPKDGPHVRFGHEGNSGGIDVAEDGTIYMVAQNSNNVHLLPPDRKQVRTVRLKGVPAPAKGRSNHDIKELRVFGDDLIVRFRDDTELFRVYDRKTGELRRAVEAQAERLRVTLEGRNWVAGGKASLKVELEPATVKAPNWHVWLRS